MSGLALGLQRALWILSLSDLQCVWMGSNYSSVFFMMSTVMVQNEGEGAGKVPTRNLTNHLMQECLMHTSALHSSA